MTPRRIVLGWIVAAAALLIVVPGAFAAQRFASPTGAGDCSTAGSPCSYETAILAAGNGDEVILAPGDYGSAVSPRTTTVYTYNPVNVHGIAGQPRPRIFSNATYPMGLYDPGSTISHVDIERVATSAGAGLDFRGTLAEDMIVTDAGTAGSAACRLNGTVAVVRNSECFSTGGTGGAGVLVSYTLLPGTNTITLRNVTAVARGVGSPAISVSGGAGSTLTVNAVNTIFEGYVDVYAGGSGPATANLSYSEAHTNQQDPPGGQINTDATDVYAYPTFVDFPGSDFHQLAESSTVDKGIDDPLNGTTDWDGEPRTAGARTDIGADEYIPPATPGPVVPPAGPPAQTPAPVTPSSVKPTEPKGLKAADIVKLPSAKACVSRRLFQIHLRRPKGVTIASATVRLTGRKARLVKGRALTAPVNLRGLPKGRFTVKITVVTATGRVLVATRKYRTCVPKRR